MDTKKIIKICLLTPPSVASKSAGGSALQQELQAQQESESNKVRVFLLVNEDLVPYAYPQRIFVQKPCSSTCKRPSVTFLTFGRDFPPANVASKLRQPKSCSRHPQNLGNRTFGEPFWPEPVVPQGHGRIDCRVCMPVVHPNPRLCPQGQEDQGRVCPLSHRTPSSPVLRFPCIRPYTTRGNKEGRCLLQQPPKQEDTKSSPLSSMELKFELDTRLTISCVVAVTSAYGLVTVSFAIYSVLLVFSNTVILLLILFVLFGWRELLEEFGKKRSAAK